MSRAFSAKIQAEAFARANGRCEQCGGMLKPGQFQYDHKKPHALGGESSLENAQCLCSACHIAKGQEDMPPMRKADKQAKVKKQLPVAAGASEIARRFRQ
jgi:5-methylcytosine-specific restriction protein A